MANNAAALNDILFAALRSVNDDSKEVDIERARATSMIAKDIISLAKLEAHHAKESGNGNTSFLGEANKPALPQGITGVTQHRIK